jgi:hypothetical protein
VLLSVYFINHKHDWFLRFAQHPRQFRIHWRQTFLSVDNEKEKITLAQGVLGGVPYLLGQFGFACAENPAGVPKCEWPLAASAGCRKPVARDPGLIMNNRNFPANKTVEQRRLAYVGPSDNRHVGQRVRVIHQSSQHLWFRRMRVAFGLQLTHAVCNVDDP